MALQMFYVCIVVFLYRRMFLVTKIGVIVYQAGGQSDKIP